MTMISKQRETASNAPLKRLQPHAQPAGMMTTPLVTQVVTVAIGTSERNTPAALSMMPTSQPHKLAVHAGNALLTTQ